MNNLLNFPAMLAEYKRCQEIRENYRHTTQMNNEEDKEECAKYFGVHPVLFFVSLILHLMIFVWAMVLIIVRWQELSTPVKVIGMIGLFMFPVLTLVLVYAETYNKHPVQGLGSIY
jgi:hypothetical protein